MKYCIHYSGIFFNTCMKKVLFLHRKVNRKSNFSSVWRGLPLLLFLPLQQEEKYFSSCYTGRKSFCLPLYDDSICPISHSLFMQKKVLFLHLLKKVLCVTREQLTFSDSDDDFEHSCITRDLSSSSLEKVNFPPQLHNVLFSAECGGVISFAATNFGKTIDVKNN